MADLKITELAALAAADLASGDLLPLADISASETKKITVTDLLSKGVTLIPDATIPNAKIVFGSASIPGSALANGAVGTTQIANDAVTAAKLGDQSVTRFVATLPASGDFVGQFAIDTSTLLAWVWTGSQWTAFRAAGSFSTVIGSSVGIVNIVPSGVGDQLTLTATLDSTTAAGQFLAGPASAAGAPGYRTISGTDLPVASSSTRGGVVVNGNGLTMNSGTLAIDNSVTAEASAYHVVRYNSSGLVTGGRALAAGDVPLATSNSVGVVSPGSGLSVSGAGALGHSNSIASGTASKVTFDAQGHITGTSSLEATDIPGLSADKITSGTFSSARIGAKAVDGTKLSDYSIGKIAESAPTPDFISQLFFNPLERTLFMWDGNVYQPIGVSYGQIVFACTYDASTNKIASVTTDGTAVGLAVNQPLPASSATNRAHYVVVEKAGTGTSPAPAVSLAPPDILISTGSAWILLDVSDTITAQIASNVGVTPTGGISSTNVQAALAELDTEKLATAGGTVTGEVLIGNTGSLKFEGSSNNDFETTLGVVDPTADRSINLPNLSGTVALTSQLDDGTY